MRVEKFDQDVAKRFTVIKFAINQILAPKGGNLKRTKKEAQPVLIKQKLAVPLFSRGV